MAAPLAHATLTGMNALENLMDPEAGMSPVFGVRIWLVMTFNYPVLWVRVKGQGLGFG